MKIILFLDDKNGMLFNSRRQSRDEAVCLAIARQCVGNEIWMNAYSARLYGQLEGIKIRIAEDFLSQAGENAYALVETEPLQPFVEKITEMLVFRWNRVYPADVWLNVDLNQWAIISTVDFAGKSHEQITQIIYQRKDMKK